MKKSEKSQEAVLCRILDANFNRSKEALRVLEECSRFILNDAGMTRSFKKLRHDISSILLKFPVPYRKLVAARESEGDVGKKSFLSDKKGKLKFHDLAVSNAKRGQESLRVMEEFSKMIAGSHSKDFQDLRFRLYTLEKRAIARLSALRHHGS